MLNSFAIESNATLLFDPFGRLIVRMIVRIGTSLLRLLSLKCKLALDW